MRDIISLVDLNKPPAKRRKHGNRGRKPVHSWGKLLVCICLIMAVLGFLTFRDMQNLTPKLSLPWDEPYPDHSTIHRAYQSIPREYLEAMLGKAAQLCIAEVAWERGVLASDSSGVETDRYEEVVRPNMKKGCFEKKVRKLIHLKYHIVAILDYLIILKAKKVTSHRCGDSPTLRTMLKGFAALPGCVFNADRGFDAELNFERLYELKMKPNIKQRTMRKEGKRGRGRRRLHYRSKASREFDPELYRYRGMVEAIFGAEESDGHNLHTRFRRKENWEKWGTALAIGWNLKVLNRLRCAKNLGIEVTPLTTN